MTLGRRPILLQCLRILGDRRLHPTGRRGRERGGSEAEAGPESLRWGWQWGAWRAPALQTAHLTGIFSSSGEVRCPGSAVPRVTTFPRGDACFGAGACSQLHWLCPRTPRESGGWAAGERGSACAPRPRTESGGGAEHPCPEAGVVPLVTPRPPAARRALLCPRQFLDGSSQSQSESRGQSLPPAPSHPTLQTRTLTSGRVPMDLTWLAGD